MRHARENSIWAGVELAGVTLAEVTFSHFDTGIFRLSSRTIDEQFVIPSDGLNIKKKSLKS